MKISLGNDHAGYILATKLIRYLVNNNIEVIHRGTFNNTESVDYPDFAEKVANDVSAGQADYGILVCKTGIGMCVAANKIPHIRAANCLRPEMATYARTHNDANVLCLGSYFTTFSMAKKILMNFISYKFEGGRHLRRLQKIDNLENKNLNTVH